MTTGQATSGQSSASGSRTGNTSGKPPSPIADGGYPLAGISNHPDPQFHAYRQDLADVALAGRVIASHYAEPLLRHVVAAAPLHGSAGEEGEVIGELAPGDEFRLLDSTGGWAWGYAGKDRRVGYVKSDAIGI